MKPWMLSELKDVLGCDVPTEAEITCVSTDTRDLPQGCLFVALRGEKFDAHDFVKQAIKAGAVAAVTEKPIEGCPCLVVKHTGRALLQIARFYREKFHPTLVGITGSVGKTTTKEMIACVLESQYATLKTQGNFNNEVGLPKTLFGLEDSHEAAVIEMGMSHFGEISRLSRTAEPCIGVITNIGYSHIENLKTQEGIRQAKLEIQDGMAEDAPLVVNGDDPLLAPLKKELSRPVITYGMHSDKADVRAVEIQRQAQSTAFSIRTEDGKTYPVELPCAGDHNAMNALAAFCVGRLAGIDPADYQNGKFTDVKADAYYAPYVNWAAQNGIVEGVTATTFAPDSNINREQMAVIMANYAKKLGYDLPKTLQAVTFADNAQISSWAKNAVRAMQQAGILAGKNGNKFDPKGTATRAEVATILRRFVEIVIDPQTANGWQQNDSGQWSYYRNGKPVKGRLSDDQKWYWLDKTTGMMFAGGWKQIDGKWYYFYADGSMAVSTKVDGYEVGTDGARR